ncbi:isoleucine--tRNA ligase [Photobacterium sp. GJ3]|nr:isoleucine--tRNA ligase [Photobacterium sp. GJ3]
MGLPSAVGSGRVYQGEKVVAYSTALETVLSNFEATSNYQDVQDPALTVLFRLADEDAYFAAWTTTPWTLPSNLALCVGPAIDYVKVRDETAGCTFWLAQAQLDVIGKGRSLTVLAHKTGADLAGMRYLPLFDDFAHMQADGAFRVLADDFVSTDNGTGIVHLAPAFGEDDQRVARAHGLDAAPCPLDSRGCFTAEVAAFQGMYIKDADKPIIRALQARGQLYRQETIVHSYPFCPRSDTPIIYRTVPSWYIRVEPMRDALVANNQQVNWVPEHLKEGRMGNWLAGAKDWAVSRNRYWGTPLPIWVNDTTGNRLCLGSREELARYTGVTVADLHRDHVDALTFTLPGEAGVYRRIDEVFDCWFESGAMPYAQVHYPFENKDQFEKNFPAAFIAEGVDQTRGWFYTLQVLSHCLFGKAAFNNVIVNGIVMAEDGKKMSKRLKNYTAPDVLMEQYGADALRLYLINSGLVKAEEQRFSDNGVQDMVRRVLLPWYNGYQFFATYAGLDQWQAAPEPVPSDNILDQWILSRLQTLIRQVNTEMQQYRLYQVVPALFEFLEQLTNWYIRLNRARFWQSGMTEDKAHAYQTLFRCLETFGTLMAPFAPFLSEHLYQAMLAFRQPGSVPESVHLCTYPVAETALQQPMLEASVERFQHLVIMGRQKRNELKIKIKTPLNRMTVLHRDPAVLADVARLSDYIRTELNVKTVLFSEHEADYIDFYAKPNFAGLGRRLGPKMKHYSALIQSLTEAQLMDLQTRGQLTLDGEVFSDEDIVLYRQAKTGTHAVSNRFISLDVDPELTDALIGEGAVREVISRIQKLRKDSGFAVSDRIRIDLQASDMLADWVTRHQAYLMAETLAVVLEVQAFTDSASGKGQVFSTEHGEIAISVAVVPA